MEGSKEELIEKAKKAVEDFSFGIKDNSIDSTKGNNEYKIAQDRQGNWGLYVGYPWVLVRSLHHVKSIELYPNDSTLEIGDNMGSAYISIIPKVLSVE
jgi:hypothetical protein